MSRLPFFRSLLWAALLPLSLLWAAGTWLRRYLTADAGRFRSRLPVICVGNVHTGGSGKTPLVAEMAVHFSSHGPIILSRGYGGSLSREGGWIDRSLTNGPTRFGDEPWMLAEQTRVPVYVGKDRRRALEVIEQRPGVGLVIMDDGFQHLRVKPTVSLVAIQTARDPLDAFCLPLGDLREPLGAVRDADAVILVGEDRDAERWIGVLRRLSPSLPVFSARRKSLGLWHRNEAFVPGEGGRLVGFCGIAAPETFVTELAAYPGASLVKAFPDHHAYNTADLEALKREKRALGADAFVTTEKDWHKVAPRLEAEGETVLCLRISYELSAELWRFLGDRLEAAWPRS